jgi:TRAP-type C4-dicarboxylate transport system substrate-binding protein
MAVDKKTFEKIGAEDQAIVHEVMGRIYENFDKVNLVDNAAAFDALLNSGIKPVEFDQEEFVKTRKVLLASNRQLGEQGKFSLELYDEMMRYLDEYRSQHGASGPD